MFLTNLHIKNFRCFTDAHFDLMGQLIVIEGLNGSGKTSLIEALHYLCYLRSFRTHIPRDLINFDADSFFIKAQFNHAQFEGLQEIQVGFSGKKKLVRINQKFIESYKELLDYYRIITLTEDDLGLIQGSPDIRRNFIDQVIMINNPDFLSISKKLKHIVEQRTSLLQKKYDYESYVIWTEQLWQVTKEIQYYRIQALEVLQGITNQLLNDNFDSLIVSFDYKEKIASELTFQQFRENNTTLAHQEQRFGRSLFGAHLDDIVIQFQEKKSKNFASRGQQKLIMVLLKVAQIKQLLANRGPVIFLLDDFMTDFDQQRAFRLVDILFSLPIQLIFTFPMSAGPLGEKLISYNARKILLTH